MNLKFKEKFPGYLSIKQSFKMPEFSGLNVITGTNGSGKSHLFEAIKHGYIEVFVDDDKIDHENEILLFDYVTFKVKNEQAVKEGHYRAESQKIFTELQNNTNQLLNNFQPVINTLQSNFGLPNGHFVVSKLLKAIEDKVAMSTAKPSNLNPQQEAQFNALVDNLRNSSLVESYKNRLSSVLKNQGTTTSKYFQTADELLLITLDDFTKKIQEFTPNVLEETLSSVYDNFHNRMQEFNARGLTQEQHDNLNGVQREKIFTDVYGELPWVFLNRMFDSFNKNGFTFPCETKQPWPDIAGNIKAQLFNKETHEEIEFEQLSSGEKILLALSIFVYQASSGGKFPKLLLLDEVDAPLNPSLTESFLNAIREGFVDQGVKVIISTHDPSTVASLADNDPVFLKEQNTLELSTRENAVERLSNGFFTLKKTVDILEKVTEKEAVIITEGTNVDHIEKAISIIDPGLINKVGVLRSIESGSGDMQLKSLFDLFSLAKIEKTTFFVWDCDCITKPKIKDLEKKYGAIPYIFPKNEQNKFAVKGIENLYSDKVLRDYITEQNGVKFLHDKDKQRFLKEKVLNLNKPTDFKGFNDLIGKIQKKVKTK